MNEFLEIDISDLQYSDYAEYLIESVSTDRIIEFNTANGSGTIVRNAGRKERDSMIGPTKDIGFIVHIPSKNVYFFDRELLSHASAGYRIGLDANGSRVKDCICGYYDPVSTTEQLDMYNVSRIRISGVSSDTAMIRPDVINTLIEAFTKALIRPAPSDFSVSGAVKAKELIDAINSKASL
jgi:hypothetical protein